jgi:putative lipase involved disintegration of autophagic bodies
MKIATLTTTVISFLLMTSCGSGENRKSAEEWSSEVCDCVHNEGVGAQACNDKIQEIHDYYSDDEYEEHDKAIHLITTDCPEAILF